MKDSSGKTATLKLTATLNHDGRQYRCKISNSIGSVYSKNVTLTVRSSKPVIITQPESRTVTAGNSTTFKVVASGGNLKYQWYMREAGGSLKPLKAASAKTASLKVVTSMTHNGRQYCCKVWNSSGSTYSKTVTLKVVQAKPVIKTQPESRTATAGNTTTFKVVAAGGNLRYQWYMREAGGSLKPLKAVSAKTASLKVVTSMTHNGRQYCCKVWNSSGSTYTKTVTLKVVQSKPVIKTQPANRSVSAGSTVTFSVSAVGGNLKYQWYMREAGGSLKPLKAVSAKTASLKVRTSSSQNGRQYCCKIWNSADSTYTRTVTLSVH